MTLGLSKSVSIWDVDANPNLQNMAAADGVPSRAEWRFGGCSLVTRWCRAGIYRACWCESSNPIRCKRRTSRLGG